MRLRRLFLLTMALAPLAWAAPASAIPAFARKYRVSCSMCHSGAPRLNAFGEQFAGNGFEFAPGEEPRDTIDTGDPLLRLVQGLPLAVRLDAYIQANPGRSGSAKTDLQTPWNIKLLSGGPIANRISYYMYFFMSEHGEVAGLEDAYIQFTDLGGTGVSIMAGQFQVSDPLFKRELRLTVEDYQAYRVRVGQARANLTYDRGLMAVWSPWEGGDVALQVVNGRGLTEAGEDRLYDRDSWKNFAGRLSQSLGPVRVGGFVYYGDESQNGFSDRIVVFGPDATLELGHLAELNLQYLRRIDDNPFFVASPVEDVEVDAGFAELIIQPQGPGGRLFLTALYNHVRADGPVVTLGVGELAPVSRYSYGAAGVSWLLQRNVRLQGEAGWDFRADRARLTAGVSTAF
jgi:hypothetical protein